MSYPASVRVFITFALVAAGSGCSSTPTGVEELVGRYELRSVDGRAVPVDALGGARAGELVLSAGGHARRVVQYATSGIPGPIIVRASGSYRVRSSEITFDLDEELRPSGTRRRRVRGEARPPSIVLRYPGRGDRMVEERYVRVTP